MARKEPRRYGSDRQSEALQTEESPRAEVVEAFHQNSDVDSRQEAQHHTLGPGPNQAAPGDHNHRDGSSQPLLTGVTISGSRGGNVALVSIIQALVALGATDSSTP